MQDPDGIDINTKIFNSVAEVFQKAQGSYAGHRKHIAVLKKIQSKAVEQGYEDAFNFWFDKLVTKILPLKKNEIIGDRIVKLVAAFIASLERELILAKKQNYKLTNDEEGIFSRFVDQFIRHVLRGVESPDKNVRFRVLQLLAVIMDNIGEIDESLFNLLILSLNKRIYDREPTVRIQAVFCLTKFQDEEQTEHLTELSDNEENFEATRTLVASIQNDPSAEVRRAAMLNLINDNNTRPYILERARDVNIVNRRLVYSRILKSMGRKCFDDIEPHIFDQLIEWGLEDRELSVRNACKRLIAHDWLNALDGDLIELLEKLDVSRSSVCVKAIEALFQSRPDILSKIKFPESIWKDFTVEIAFLFRAIYLYCLDNNITEMLEENFPEASKLSEHLNHYILLRYHHNDISNDSQSHFDYNTLEFIIEQLLIAAERYDYSDEVGRRSMLTVVRNMLALTTLSEPLIKIGIRVMKSLSINEKDFVTMAIEIINDIRDDDIEKQEQEEKIKSKKINRRNETSVDEEDENGTHNDEVNEDEEDDNISSFHSAVENLVQGNGNVSESDIINNLPPEKEASSATIVLCLTRSSYMLELVNTPLTENILIASLMDTLITPAVRNTAPNIRELGVKNLGLCCLLDVKLAIDNMYILGMCVSKGNASLKYIALQVIVDIFSVHGNTVVDGEGKVDSISLHKIFYKVLKNNGLPECQVIAAEGLCKLFLADVFTDDDLFETLVLSYFSPINSSNEALVQAFAFCIPVYCFSHPAHQQRMSRTAADILLRLCVLWDDLQSSVIPEVDREAMLKPNIIFQQLLFWTDPRNLVNQTGSTKKDTVQLTFLIDVLKIYAQIEKKEIKKMIITNINAIFLSSEQDYSTLKELLEYSDDIAENDNLDNVSKNALDKLRNNLNSLIEEINERSEAQTKDENNTANDQYSSILGNSFNKSSNDTIEHAADITDGNNTELTKITVNISAVDNTTEQSNSRKRTRSEAEQIDTSKNLENMSIQDTSTVAKNVSFVLPDEKSDAMSIDEEDKDSESFSEVR
ncbi:Ycg1p [Saccharomyces cerevisiae YJM1419]|nr:Ycg1p [Saccharomyces cerevisiae YJM451]AJU72151.1 Ycg1p [Saccharomyces cerevisiae YJM682]AJU82548.1 Ycg1p [Saccharomyces cerevisiae YJM1133]AJV00109.1 Ycg1p [Saccharomyces cerevisiae YJM1386]AJV07867.1 Ycg1p [Saccharomyces cerevisiae YJM1419]AJV18260.1 Ycg1p [Saccharomyces cerevisiae YJM1549]KZV12566.1 YCG1 [Saccharomyces cerevisiae]